MFAFDGEKAYNKAYQEVPWEGRPEIERFPDPSEFDSLEAYCSAVGTWKLRCREKLVHLAGPTTIWSTMKCPLNPYINKRLPNRIPEGQLGPENQLAMLSLILQGDEERCQGNFPVKGRFGKDVPVSAFVVPGKPEIVAPEPNPEMYDSYQEYLEAVVQWTAIVEKTKAVPSKFSEGKLPKHHPGKMYVPPPAQMAGVPRAVPKVSKVNESLVAEKLAELERAYRESVNVIEVEEPTGVERLKAAEVQLPLFPRDFLQSIKDFGCHYFVHRSSAITRALRNVERAVIAVSGCNFDELPEALGNMKENQFLGHVLFSVHQAILTQEPRAALVASHMIDVLFDKCYDVVQQYVLNSVSLSYEVALVLSEFSSVAVRVIDPMAKESEEIMSGVVLTYYNVMANIHLTTAIALHFSAKHHVAHMLGKRCWQLSQNLTELLEHAPQVIDWMLENVTKHVKLVETFTELLFDLPSDGIGKLLDKFVEKNSSILHVLNSIASLDPLGFRRLTIFIVYSRDSAVIIARHILALCQSNPRLVRSAMSAEIVKLVSSLLYVDTHYLEFRLDAYFALMTEAEKHDSSALCIMEALPSFLKRMIAAGKVPRDDIQLAVCQTCDVLNGILAVHKKNYTIVMTCLKGLAETVKLPMGYCCFRSGSESLALIFSLMTHSCVSISKYAWIVFGNWILCPDVQIKVLIKDAKFCQGLTEMKANINSYHITHLLLIITKILERDNPSDAASGFISLLRKDPHGIDFDKVLKQLQSMEDLREVQFRQDVICRLNSVLKRRSQLSTMVYGY